MRASLFALTFMLFALELRAEGAFPVSRCMNLSNALGAPAEGDWGYRIERQHLQAIAAQGFDTVRLPVRFSAHADAQGRIEASLLARVDEVIAWARAFGLSVIVDLHHYWPLMDDPDAHETRFVAIWDGIADHFSDAPEDVIFELVNEPEGDLDTRRAVALQRRVLERIRPSHPDRWIIIQGGNWSFIDTLPELTPATDARTVRSFHFYEPFEFTHQGAQWVEDPPPLGTGWGSPAERRALESRFDAAQSVGGPLFLGEFGAIKTIPQTDRATWLRAVRLAAEARGISWCVWGFAADFATYDFDEGAFDAALIGALLGKD